MVHGIETCLMPTVGHEFADMNWLTTATHTCAPRWKDEERNSSAGQTSHVDGLDRGRDSEVQSTVDSERRGIEFRGLDRHRVWMD